MERSTGQVAAGACMPIPPNDAEKVAAAIERVGGKAYIIHPDVGTRIE